MPVGKCLISTQTESEIELWGIGRVRACLFESLGSASAVQRLEQAGRQGREAYLSWVSEELWIRGGKISPIGSAIPEGEELDCCSTTPEC